MTPKDKSAGIFGMIEQVISDLTRSDVFWGATISLADPEWRRMSEEFAFWLRDRFNIKLKDDKQRKYAERILGAMRGAFERIIDNRFDHALTAVLAEKIFIDGPDFAASVLFANPEEFAMRRALRAHAMVRKGLMTDDEMRRAEESIGPMFGQLMEIMSDMADEGGKEVQFPTTTPWSSEEFPKFLRQAIDTPQIDGEVPVHNAAKPLKDKLMEINDAMGERLLRFFGLNPDPELQKELDEAIDERNRARSRLDQLRLLADIRAQTAELNERAAEAAQAVQDATAGLPVDKGRIYENRRRWRKRRSRGK